MSRLKTAVFPVGGLGTRFLPATKSMPKEMLPVVNKPIIQYAFEEAANAGIEHFIFIIGRNKNILNNHFDHSYELQTVLSEKEKSEELEMVSGWLPKAGNIAFVRQLQPLGLGHAVWCARHFIQDDYFAVILADELLKSPNNFMKTMLEKHSQMLGNMIAVNEVKPEDTDKYGIIDGKEITSDLLKITSMLEKPKPSEAPSNLAIIGRYILHKDIFTHLRSTKQGVGGEIQLTDAMSNMLSKQDFFAMKYSGERFDCGNPVGLLEANIAYALCDPNMSETVKNILSKYSRI